MTHDRDTPTLPLLPPTESLSSYPDYAIPKGSMATQSLPLPLLPRRGLRQQLNIIWQMGSSLLVCASWYNKYHKLSTLVKNFLLPGSGGLEVPAQVTGGFGIYRRPPLLHKSCLPAVFAQEEQVTFSGPCGMSLFSEGFTFVTQSPLQAPFLSYHHPKS